MSKSGLDQITQLLSKTEIRHSGVSFQGKSLKLDSESDCKELVEAIEACDDLHFLNLEGNTFGVEAVKAISKVLQTKKELKRALWKDMFTGRMKTEIPIALQYLGSGLNLAGAQLTELDLSDNAFGPIGMKGLAGLLSSRTCFTLQELKLNNNGMGIQGGKMLASALLECHQKSSAEGKSLALRLFIAGRNRLENDGAAALAKVFETLGTLEVIEMPQNGIYHKGLKALSSSLAKNPNLKVLNLNDNTFTVKGAKYLAEVLPCLQKLQVLNLGDCLVKTNGAIILGTALQEKHLDLEEVNLGYNEIKIKGGLALAKAMKNKSKMANLIVNGNMFGEKGRVLFKNELKLGHWVGNLSPNLSEDEEYEDSDDSEGEENGNGNDVTGGEEDSECEEEEEDEADEAEEYDEDETSESDLQDTQDTGKLTSILSSLTVTSPPKGALQNDIPLNKFLGNPSVDGFLAVEKIEFENFLFRNQQSSTEFYVDTFIPALIKISSLSTCSHDAAKTVSLDLSLNLYKKLFEWALEKNSLSTVNNVLFVHLGLIKSEDKEFHVNWNLEGCMTALNRAVSQGFVPMSTQSILHCCLDKEVNRHKITEVTIA